MTQRQKDQLKAQGFIPQKEDGFFTARIPSDAGNLSCVQAGALLDIARHYGRGYYGMTTRMSVEIPWISERDVEAVKAALRQAGLASGGTGKRVRPLVACKGSVCTHGLYDTQGAARALTLHWLGQPTPGKFKLNLSGCPNNCAKVQLNDLGVLGRQYPCLDATACVGCGRCLEACKPGALSLKNQRIALEETCVGCGDCARICPAGALRPGETQVELFAGGTFGRTLRIGRSLGTFALAELEGKVEKILAWYRANGQDGERLFKTLERVGWEALKNSIT